MPVEILSDPASGVARRESTVARTLAQTIATLGMREKYRDRYWQHRDPIFEDRLLWRAQTFRHLVHLLPTQTILELGAGRGLFTRQLYRVSRGRNPITAVTFKRLSSSNWPLRVVDGLRLPTSFAGIAGYVSRRGKGI